MFELTSDTFDSFIRGIREKEMGKSNKDEQKAIQIKEQGNQDYKVRGFTVYSMEIGLYRFAYLGIFFNYLVCTVINGYIVIFFSRFNWQ